MSKQRRLLFAALAVGLVAMAIVYGLPMLQKPGIEKLARQALEGSPAKQVEAAQQLAQLGKPAVEALRGVMMASENHDVIAVSILGLSRNSDYESMDNILSQLDDSSATVRSAAATAATQLLGRDHHFPVNGSLERRMIVKNEMLKDWKEYNGSELFEFNKNRIHQ